MPQGTICLFKYRTSWFNGNWNAQNSIWRFLSYSHWLHTILLCEKKNFASWNEQPPSYIYIKILCTSNILDFHFFFSMYRAAADWKNPTIKEVKESDEEEEKAASSSYLAGWGSQSRGGGWIKLWIYFVIVSFPFLSTWVSAFCLLVQLSICLSVLV